MNAIGTRTRAGASFCTRKVLYTCDLQPAVVDDAEREGEVPVRVDREAMTSLKSIMNQWKRSLVLRGFGSEGPADKSCGLGTGCEDV